MTDPPSARQILVVGATAGLARASLERLSQAGESLILCGRDRDALEALSEALPGHARFVVGDLADPDALVAKLWQCAAAHPQRGLPSALAVFTGIPGRLSREEQTPDALAQLFCVNTAAPLLLIRAWAERLRDQIDGGPGCGCALMLSTMQAVYPFEGSLAYALSKAAIARGVEVLAKGCGPRIAVNAIAPGVNDAGMARSSIAKGKYAPYLEQEIIRRYGRPEDLAAAVEWMLTRDGYLTGQTILLDGGLCLRRDQR